MQKLIEYMTGVKDVLSLDTFSEWFGHSKVSKDGKPLVVYHGTAASFESFKDYGREILAFFTTSSRFAERFALTGSGTPRIIPCYLKVEKPFDFRKDSRLALTFYQETQGITDKEDIRNIALCPTLIGEHIARVIYAEQFYECVRNGEWEALESKQFVSWLRGEGFDGIIIMEDEILNYAVFEKNQIKSIFEFGTV